MTPTTELEAVNFLLATIGESPVNSLTDAPIEAELAQETLAETSRAVQSQGWHFNTDPSYKILPDLSGNINLPASTLRADASRSVANKDLVQRGTRMYDRQNHTYDIGEPTELDLVVGLDFTDLPEVARRYITAKAARVYQGKLVGSESLNNFAVQEEREAYIAMQEFENSSADANIFETPSVFAVINRRFRGY